MEKTTGTTQLTLRLRRRVELVPVAAVVTAVAWAVATAAVAGGPNGALAGALMALVGIALAAYAVTFAGYVVRPLRLDLDPGGLTVRLPTWPARTVPWASVTGAAALALRTGSTVRTVVVVDLAPGERHLPRTCRPAAMYRKLAPALGRPGRTGLCFEGQIFDIEPAELLAALRAHAPAAVPVEDRTAQPLPTPWQY
ncbi:hypothetical protein [Streptomyces purpureus]|uniref:hypothetical protein n=1 Tax=Streptomyces purpureus TaxID=1951 RepID=UPI00039986C2|nr:hypothetical protein [Streptomyces purpureus]